MFVFFWLAISYQKPFVFYIYAISVEKWLFLFIFFFYLYLILFLFLFTYFYWFFIQEKYFIFLYWFSVIDISQQYFNSRKFEQVEFESLPPIYLLCHFFCMHFTWENENIRFFFIRYLEKKNLYTGSYDKKFCIKSLLKLAIFLFCINDL